MLCRAEARRAENETDQYGTTDSGATKTQVARQRVQGGRASPTQSASADTMQLVSPACAAQPITARAESNELVKPMFELTVDNNYINSGSKTPEMTIIPVIATSATSTKKIS